MSSDQTKVDWQGDAEEKFKLILGKVPIFMRSIAEQKVGRKAEALAKAANRPAVTEKDLVDAFFAETPFGFHGPMKSDMEEFNINYQQYGYAR